MNLIELKQSLQQHNVRKDMYEFEDEFPNESYCLRFNGQVWETYYSERGKKLGLNEFESEAKACESFFRHIIKEKLDLKL